MGKGKAVLKRKKTKARIRQKQKLLKKKKNIAKVAGKKGKKIIKKTAIIKQSSKQLPVQAPQYLIAVSQINTLVGDILGNTKKIIACIEKARESGASLVVFPELTITGCHPKDLLLRTDFVDMNMQKFIEVVNACKGITCIFGFVNKGNKILYNSAAIVKDQKILGIQNKIHLNTNIFDEKRYFLEGSGSEIVIAGNSHIGVVLCTEIAEEDGTIGSIVQKGSEFVVLMSASPYSIDKVQEREQQVSNFAKKYQVPIIYCNLVGAQDEFIFDGRSFGVDKNGLVISRAKQFSEDMLLLNLHAPGKAFIPPRDKNEEIYQALSLGIMDYFTKTAYNKAVIGISGGIDSAVTATLAVHALGKDRVTGLILPSKITPKESIHDAKRLCSNLKINYKIINIDQIVIQSAKTLGMAYDKKNISVTEQDIQALVRLQILKSYANKNKGVVIAACNKTDIAVGSFYEDSGILAPLGDLWKTQVKTLAVFLNVLNKQKHKTNIIPDSIIKKEPSAELRPGQKDTDDIALCDILDKILEMYLSQKKDMHEIIKSGFDADLVRRIATMVINSEFKRKQLPTLLSVTNNSFGSLWRYPVVNGWSGQS